MSGIIIKKLSSAMNAMRRPDARLIQTFSYYGKPDYWIAPGGGRVESKIAEQIIAHPQVIGGKPNGLTPRAFVAVIVDRNQIARANIGGGRYKLIRQSL